eukprot:TRINITY_DN615_c0_g2_i22.p1 TRINITY_DN615_c0_g2~~TRINITY_DN615_c0_g2_i22.p1  ORF type:complete len:227 (+),score=40.75 TRINITY_DN615_c0_g2_i22:43-723(+)
MKSGLYDWGNPADDIFTEALRKYKRRKHRPAPVKPVLSSLLSPQKPLFEHRSRPALGHRLREVTEGLDAEVGSYRVPVEVARLRATHLHGTRTKPYEGLRKDYRAGSVRRYQDIMEGVRDIDLRNRERAIASKDVGDAYRGSNASSTPVLEFTSPKFTIGKLVNQIKDPPVDLYNTSVRRDPLRCEVRKLQEHVSSMTPKDYSELPKDYQSDLDNLAASILALKKS